MKRMICRKKAVSLILRRSYSNQELSRKAVGLSTAFLCIKNLQQSLKIKVTGLQMQVLMEEGVTEQSSDMSFAAG